jgi:hypothetical protein
MNVTLPNGTVIEDVPDGMGKWEIAYKAINNGLAKEEDFPELDFNASKMVENIPSDAANYAGGMVQSALHPIKTAQAMMKLGGSGLANIADKLGWEQPEESLAPGKEFDRMMRGRYGSTDNFLASLEESPVATFGDMAMALSGAGTVAKAANLPTVGKAAAYASNLIDPVANAARVTKLAGQAALNIPGLRSIPEKLYQSGTRFDDLSLSREALRRGIDPSKPLDEIIRDKNFTGQRIGQMVQEADQQMKSAPPSALTKGLSEMRDSLASPGIQGTRQLRSFDKFVADLENQLGITPTKSSIIGVDGDNLTFSPSKGEPPNVPAHELQRFKTDAWKRLYGESKYVPERFQGKLLRDSARKASNLVAQNANEALGGILGDEYKAANKEYGMLKDLIKELEPINSRLTKGSHAGVVLPSGAGGAVGYSMGGRLGALVGSLGAILATRLNTPKNRIRKALQMNETQNAGLRDYADVKAPNLGKYGAVSNKIEEERIKKLKKMLGLRP